MEREEPEHAVANPGRIVAQPAFGPGPSKNLFGYPVDLSGGENRQAKRQDDPSPNLQRPAGVGANRQDAKTRTAKGWSASAGLAMRLKGPKLSKRPLWVALNQPNRSSPRCSCTQVATGRSISIAVAPMETAHVAAAPAIHSRTQLRLRPGASPASSLEKSPKGVSKEEFPVPDVAREHGVGCVPGLLPDLEGRDARTGRARREAGPQAMAGIPGRVEPCGGNPVAKDQGYGFAGQSTDREAPVSIDGPEDGTVLDPRGVERVFQRPDRAANGSAERDVDPPADAVLVGLRPPDSQDNPLPDPFDVNEVDRSKLGTPEAPCEPDQKQSPIPEVLDPVAHRPENDEKVLTEKRPGLTLSRPVSAANAAHGRPDQRTGRRVWEAPGPVRDRDRGKTPRQSGDLQGGGVTGDIGGHHVVGRRDSSAPRLEVVEVSAVGPPGRGATPA